MRFHLELFAGPLELLIDADGLQCWIRRHGLPAHHFALETRQGRAARELKAARVAAWRARKANGNA